MKTNIIRLNTEFLTLRIRYCWTSAVYDCFFLIPKGAWKKKGLGQVVLMEGKRVWTFTAPHLGYWIAASASSSRGTPPF